MVEPAPAVRASAAQRLEPLPTQRRRRKPEPAPNNLMRESEGQAMGPLQRLQALAEGSPRVAQLRRLQTLAVAARNPLAQSQPLETEERDPSENTPNRTGMPDGLKNGIEALSGMAMDHVRVHNNSSKPAQLNAHAYAVGHEIHLAPGQEHQLPHEAWHLVQQAQGRVQPTQQLNGGTAINDDRDLEREADQMGARALAWKS